MDELLMNIYNADPSISGVGSFEQFKEAMSTESGRRQVYDALPAIQKIGTFEQLNEALNSVPVDAVPEEQPSTWFGIAKQALERGLVQADQAGIGVDILTGEVSDEDLTKLTELNQSADKKKVSPAYAKFSESKGFGEAIGNFFEAPVTIATELAVESLASFLKLGKEELIAGGLLGGGVGALVGVGATSFQLEAGLDIIGTIQEEMYERGLDPNNGQDWREVLDDEDFLAAARKRAATRGGIVALFDAVTGGLSGAVAKGGGKALVKAIAATQVEGIGGAAGEVAASLAVGDDIVGGNVLAEYIGEFGPGSVTIAAQQVADPTRKAIKGAIRGTNRGSKVDAKIYDVVLSDDPNKSAKIEDEITFALENNQITQEEADRLRSSIDDISNINQSIPSDVSSRDRRKQMMDYIQRRREIDTKIQAINDTPVDEAFEEQRKSQIEDLQRERDLTNERIKAEANPPEETISDKEFNDFQNGNISDALLDDIATKINKGETLTDREITIRNERSDEVESKRQQIAEKINEYPSLTFDYIKNSEIENKTVSLKSGEEVTQMDAIEAQNRIKSLVDKLNAVKPCL